MKSCQRRQVEEEEMEKYFKFKSKERAPKVEQSALKEIVPQKRSNGEGRTSKGEEERDYNSKMTIVSSSSINNLLVINKMVVIR